MSNIDSSLQSLALPIDELDPLPGNPREGHVGSIMASYETFGQVKPIVAVVNPATGRYTIIAGNHQLEACKRLGWMEMAVVVKDWDHDKAVAFALADNRTSELGETDDTKLYEMMAGVVDFDNPIWGELEWDDFEFALIESTYLEGQVKHQDFSSGYIPPIMVDDKDEHPVTSDEDGALTYESDDDTARQMVSQGAGSVGKAGAKTIIQYTLVFENADQQSRWYAFLRYLKSLPEMDGKTTSQQLLEYLDNVSGQQASPQ